MLFLIYNWFLLLVAVHLFYICTYCLPSIKKVEENYLNFVKFIKEKKKKKAAPLWIFKLLSLLKRALWIFKLRFEMLTKGRYYRILIVGSIWPTDFGRKGQKLFKLFLYTQRRKPLIFFLNGLIFSSVGSFDTVLYDSINSTGV